MDDNSPLLSLQNISKDFYGNVVLSDVCFDVRAGEIIGLVGENGAGKTTLMRILFGMNVIRDTGGYKGKVCIKGEEVHFQSPFDALDAGIGMAHQEFSLIPGFTTTENIVLNRESMHASVLNDVFGDRMSVLDREDMKRRASATIAKLGVNLDPDTLVSEMPVGHKQFTEIAREINREKTQILVLDEPTAVLTETEAEVLIKALRSLAAQGIAIIFISHRLHEVIEVADRVVVLRDGIIVKDTPVAGVSVRDIAAWMVGRQMASDRADEGVRTFHEDILSVDHLWVDMPGETVRDMSFTVKKGEIFGIGGLAGQGKLGIPNGIMGLFPAGGQVQLHGREVPLNEPRLALEMGMAFVSEDRRGVGLLLEESLEWNIAFTAMQIQGKYPEAHAGRAVQDPRRVGHAHPHRWLHRHPAHQVHQRRPEGHGALRRQPAEDLPGQGLRRGPRPHVRVRAHPGHRHRRQAPGAGRPAQVQPGAGHDHRHGVQRTGGAAGHLRPHRHRRRGAGHRHPAAHRQAGGVRPAHDRRAGGCFGGCQWLTRRLPAQPRPSP